jgi:hypothetical protein
MSRLVRSVAEPTEIMDSTSIFCRSHGPLWNAYFPFLFFLRRLFGCIEFGMHSHAGAWEGETCKIYVVARNGARHERSDVAISQRMQAVGETAAVA